MINLNNGDSILDSSANSIIVFDYTRFDSEEAEAKRKENTLKMPMKWLLMPKKS